VNCARTDLRGADAARYPSTLPSISAKTTQLGYTAKIAITYSGHQSMPHNLFFTDAIRARFTYPIQQKNSATRKHKLAQPR
jgi:hypothetical protein